MTGGSDGEGNPAGEDFLELGADAGKAEDCYFGFLLLLYEEK